MDYETEIGLPAAGEDAGKRFRFRFAVRLVGPACFGGSLAVTLRAMKKSYIGFAGSSGLLFLGMLLRLNARAMAWPQSYSYSGSRADTAWARQEDAIGQVGLVLMCIGGLLFVVTYFYWLFGAESKTSEPV